VATQLWLTVLVNDQDYLTMVLPPTASVMVGRDESASDLILHHPQVSRMHARIVARGTDYVLQDLGSSRGTTLNGEAVTGNLDLKTGDVVGIGPYKVRVTMRRWTHSEEDEVDSTMADKSFL
jgi:pSer/pThr/pTyr-binding forkhead associated (FHA) protein